MKQLVIVQQLAVILGNNFSEHSPQYHWQNWVVVCSVFAVSNQWMLTWQSLNYLLHSIVSLSIAGVADLFQISSLTISEAPGRLCYWEGCAGSKT